ncbi:hypothetical protein UlMin_036177 [Ulmus minor]
MVSSKSHIDNKSISGVRLSTVVPGKAREETKDQELSNMDLATKLYYIEGVYFFKIEALEGLTIDDFKVPMFPLLDQFLAAVGRIRVPEPTEEGAGDGAGGSRPFIKCNDAGVWILEAHCEKTIEEWLGLVMEDKLDDHDHDDGDGDDIYDVHDGLCWKQVLGPDLGFSPLVFLQFTWFKCGGMSLGLSWAHLLGNPFSASTFINTWGQIMSSHVPQKHLHMPTPRIAQSPRSNFPERQTPLFLKVQLPYGNNLWSASNNTKMGSHSFRVTPKQLDHLLSISYPCNQTPTLSHFEILSAMIWKSLSGIRENPDSNLITICNFESSNPNSMVISSIQADFSIVEADVSKLGFLISEKGKIENSEIEELIEKNIGKEDYILYGANLTFVNLEELEIYGVGIEGHKPVFATYSTEVVGESGVVLLLPTGTKEEKWKGQIVNVILPEDQLVILRNELATRWGIV